MVRVRSRRGGRRTPANANVPQIDEATVGTGTNATTVVYLCCGQCRANLWGGDWVELLPCHHAVCPRCLCRLFATNAGTTGGRVRCPQPFCPRPRITEHLYHTFRGTDGFISGNSGQIDRVVHAVGDNGAHQRRTLVAAASSHSSAPSPPSPAAQDPGSGHSDPDETSVPVDREPPSERQQRRRHQQQQQEEEGGETVALRRSKRKRTRTSRLLGSSSGVDDEGPNEEIDGSAGCGDDTLTPDSKKGRRRRSRTGINAAAPRGHSQQSGEEEDDPTRRQSWETRLQQLKFYKAAHGHCEPRGRGPGGDPKLKPLHNFVQYNRRHYKWFLEGDPRSRITEERIAALESIGFRWTVNYSFEERLRQLAEFRVRHGHCNVPKRNEAGENDPDGLSAWVKMQRTHYKHWMEGKKPSCVLNEEKIAELDKLGFTWKFLEDRHVVWNRRYEDLRRFKEEFGHCRVAIRYKDNPELGKWVSKMRKNMKLHFEGKPSGMTSERVRALNAINFCWDNKEAWGRKKKTEA